MRATQHFLLYALVLLVPRFSLAQGVQSCDISAFQGNVSASDGPYPALACQTCVFPVYQRVNGLDTTKILLLELSNKWIYFLGDSTTRQLHEQFLAYLDEPQVRNSLSIVNEAPKETASISSYMWVCSYLQTFVYPGEEGVGPPVHDWFKQPGRCDYVPPPYDSTQCQQNQQRCSSLYTTSRLGR